jgi:hypothetical protein
MDNNRRRERIVVDIPVTLVTVLESTEASICDLSREGAQIVGAAFPAGTKFQIEHLDQTLYAQCRWSEVDRMGVRFQFDLVDGPLHDLLALALHDNDDGRPAFAAPTPFVTHRPFQTTPFFRQAPAAFGRRTL